MSIVNKITSQVGSEQSISGMVKMMSTIKLCEVIALYLKYF